MAPQRRRNRSTSHKKRTARLVTDSHQFDLLYSDKDKAVLQNICANVVEELAYMTSLLHQYSTEIESLDLADTSTTSKQPSAKNNTSEDHATYAVPLEESFESYLATLNGYNKSQLKLDSDKNKS